ncbi:MAG: sugar phosphate isomerase/epimerase [Hyphomicrobiales bacterium]|nr:sugar phosphate isomerase/epimerase [Hyphomicrobiales bacterium]MCP5373725.1 sugar phosphate isomerase/epimerase [Hyphomicrobiales bacterium]
MRLSLCNEVIRDMDFAAQCAFAAAVGYEALEVAPFTLGEDPHLMSQDRRAQVRRAMADAGLECSSLHWLLVTPEGLSITDPDAAVRARTVDVMRRLIGLAADLDADVLVHGSPHQRRLVPGDEDASRKRARDCFAAIAGDAEQAGVVYCVEPLADRETDYLNSLDEAAALVRDIDSRGLRAMLDCASTSYMRPEPPGEIPWDEILDRWLPTGLIAHVQVNDASRRGPGEGEVRFAPVIAGLRRHGYGGWIAAEPFVYEPDGPACAARAAGYLQGLMEAIP